MRPFFADLLMVIHFLWVAFMVLGLPVGLLLRSPWFRWIHFAGMSLTALLALVGVFCPLTIWESALRRAAGGDAYPDTFIAYWLGRLLYYQAPGWVFALVYTAFGALVLASWYWVRPDRGRGRRD